jgi:hypothetical protein
MTNTKAEFDALFNQAFDAVVQGIEETGSLYPFVILLRSSGKEEVIPFRSCSELPDFRGYIRNSLATKLADHNCRAIAVVSGGKFINTKTHFVQIAIHHRGHKPLLFHFEYFIENDELFIGEVTEARPAEMFLTR